MGNLPCDAVSQFNCHRDGTGGAENWRLQLSGRHPILISKYVFITFKRYIENQEKG